MTTKAVPLEDGSSEKRKYPVTPAARLTVPADSNDDDESADGESADGNNNPYGSAPLMSDEDADGLLSDMIHNYEALQSSLRLPDHEALRPTSLEAFLDLEERLVRGDFGEEMIKKYPDFQLALYAPVRKAKEGEALFRMFADDKSTKLEDLQHLQALFPTLAASVY